jgi:hypothetical protein
LFSSTISTNGTKLQCGPLPNKKGLQQHLLEIPQDALLPAFKISTGLRERPFSLQNMDLIQPEWLCTSPENN